MVCDLERMFDPLACHVPTETSGNDNFIFSSATLQLPLPLLVTDQLIIRKGLHQYDSHYRADALLWQARKPTYRYLGLLTLSVVFHEDVDHVQVDLLNPASDIKHLVIMYPHSREPVVGYSTRPHMFNYFPSSNEEHPGCYSALESQRLDLPCFFLTNLDDFVTTDEQWEQRDTVRGFGSDEGNIRFAELLLNLSLPQNEANEYELEGEGGVRGVGPQSAETTLLLPGSVGWADLV